jgi:aryl-alcohol dehydrogenase-like predicted oxidoreductase
VEYRELPGVGPVSVIGAGLETSGVGADLHRPAGLLRQARRLEISLFDLSGNDDPRAAERMVGAAFPGDGELRVISSLSSSDLPSSGDPQALARLEQAIRESGRRLGRTMDVLALDQGVAEELHRSRSLGRLAQQSAEGSLPAIAVRLDSAGIAPPLLEELLGEKVRLYLSPWSLLDRAAESVLFDAVQAARGAVLALDPHSAGRLDGQRVLSAPWEHQGMAAPLDPVALRHEMQPVLELGYLTRDGRRTMIEAATRFALDPPVVSAAICRLQDPALTEAICAYERSPSFTAEERIRLSLPVRP